jgi:DNA gyrase subunit B
MGTGIGDMMTMEKLRYHKIIIATDADVDGAHIRTLLMTLFYRHFIQVIDGGYLYIAQPPLYKITKGKESHYAYSDEEKTKIVGKDPVVIEGESVAEDADDGEVVKQKSSKVSIQRYKGLGEMNPEELWETTMDPTKRVLKKVTIADAAEANKVFDMLMGTDVSGRKTFIQSHAHEAELDV